MATTPSDVTMLREISAAGDRGRTGALDVEWDGARVTLFFMFGHPSHVVFETADGRQLAGEPALDAFVTELPNEFRVAPWRRAMVTDDTLHFTAEDLMGLFQRRNAAVDTDGQVAEPPAPAPLAAPPAETLVAAAAPLAAPPAPPVTTAQPPFGLHDFPPLPLGTTLWTDAAANVIDLEAALPRLPDSLIVLGGPTCQGAAVVVGGRVTDAVWVNAAGGSVGDEAAHAVMNSLEGTLTALSTDDSRVMTALPMLWRAPRLGTGLPGGWLHTDDVVAEVRTSGRSCCLVVDSAEPGVALFASGELVAVYTAGHRWPATSMAALRSLLHEPGATVTVLGELEAGAPDSVGDETATEDAPPDLPATAEEDLAPADAQEATDGAAEATFDVAAEAEPATDPDAGGEPEDAGVAPPPPAVAQPRGRGRRGRGRREAEAVEPTSEAPPDAVATAAEEPSEIQPPTDVVAVSAEPESNDLDTAADGDARGETIVVLPTRGEPFAGETDEFTFATPAPAPAAGEIPQFEPAVFTIAELSPEQSTGDEEPDPSGMAGVEAREATEFVPARLDIDVDALRTELTDIATVWLGEDDAAPVARAIGAARPGVDDFVSTIRAIGAMEIPGHESAVVRAMAREMHFRASEVLCGV